MKKLLIATVLACGSLGSAEAADLAKPLYTQPDMVMCETLDGLAGVVEAARSGDVVAMVRSVDNRNGCMFAGKGRHRLTVVRSTPNPLGPMEVSVEAAPGVALRYFTFGYMVRN